MPVNNLIETKGLGKTYFGVNSIEVLKDIDLSFKSGQFVSVIGSSGSGKSTLIRLLSKLEKPTLGKVAYQKALAIGFVFQNANLLPWRTVFDNVALPLVVKKHPPANIRDKVEQVLKMVGLERYEKFFPKDLSGGMKQRVSLARALVTDPDVLFMDEPFSALDAITREKLMLELKKIWRQTKKTIIYVTHNLDEALEISERVVVLSGKPASVQRLVAVRPDTPQAATVGPREAQKNELKVFLKEKKKFTSVADFKTEGLGHKIFWGLLSALVFVAFISIWNWLVNFYKIPTYLVPSPGKVWVSFLDLAANGVLWHNALVTINEILLGLLAGAAGGLILGFFLNKHRITERILYPYIVALQSAPKIILAPLIVVWFGFGITSKILLIALIVFFPILTNTILGLKRIDRDQRDLMVLFKANFGQRLKYFEIPGILPELFAGLKIGVTLAVIGAIVGEFVGARAGLGYMAIYASGVLDTPTVFVATFTLIALGIVLSSIVRIFEVVLLPWKKD